MLLYLKHIIQAWFRFIFTNFNFFKTMFRVCTIALLLFSFPPSEAVPASIGLADPDLQPKFQVIAPNALDPSFRFDTTTKYVEVTVSLGVATTGLVGPDGVTPVTTPIWGYGSPTLGYTWPGRTFEVQKNVPLCIKWLNSIPIADGYLLTGKNNGQNGNFTGKSVVDTTLHWAYSIPGYESFTIEQHGTPIGTKIRLLRDSIP